MAEYFYVRIADHEDEIFLPAKLARTLFEEHEEMWANCWENRYFPGGSDSPSLTVYRLTKLPRKLARKYEISLVCKGSEIVLTWSELRHQLALGLGESK